MWSLTYGRLSSCRMRYCPSEALMHSVNIDDNTMATTPRRRIASTCLGHTADVGARTHFSTSRCHPNTGGHWCFPATPLTCGNWRWARRRYKEIAQRRHQSLCGLAEHPTTVYVLLRLHHTCDVQPLRSALGQPSSPISKAVCNQVVINVRSTGTPEGGILDVRRLILPCRSLREDRLTRVTVLLRNLLMLTLRWPQPRKMVTPLKSMTRSGYVSLIGSLSFSQ